MRLRPISTVLILFLSISFVSLLPGPVSQVNVRGQAPALLEVWSPDLHSSNITSLTLFPVGSQVKMVVNVTGAGPISGFDISINYYGLLGSVLQLAQTNYLDLLTGGLLDPNNAPAPCSVRVPIHSLDNPPGRIRVFPVFRGGCTVNGKGILLTLVFNVVAIGATAIDVMQGNGNGLTNSTIIGVGSQGAFDVSYIAQGAYFRNKPGIPPIAKFSFNPSSPVVGDLVQFNATQSFDPEKATGPNHGIGPEPVVYDTNNNMKYDTGEPVIVGPPPATGTVLKRDFSMLYVDKDNNGMWDPGEPVVYDSFGTLKYAAGDVVISGTAPTVGTPLSIDPKIAFVDFHAIGIWNNGYVWDFGDGSPLLPGNVTGHVFSAPGVARPASGVFSVRLVVFDADDGLPMEQIALVNVVSGIIHDVFVTLHLSQNTINPGDRLNLTVNLGNVGNKPEVVDWNATSSLNGQTLITSQVNVSAPLGARLSFTYPLQTSSLPPGSYTVLARAQLLNTTSGGLIPYSNPDDSHASATFIVQSAITKTGIPLSLVAGASIAALAAVSSAVYLLRRRRKEEI